MKLLANRHTNLRRTSIDPHPADGPTSCPPAPILAERSETKPWTEVDGVNQEFSITRNREKHPHHQQKPRETERSEMKPWAEVGGLTCSPPGKNIPILGPFYIDPLRENVPFVASRLHRLPQITSNPPSSRKNSSKVC